MSATRKQWGTHSIPVDSLGGGPQRIRTDAVPLTAAQAEYVDRLGAAWRVLQMPGEIPNGMGYTLGVACKHEHALYLYMSDSFFRTRPDPIDANTLANNAVIIWDARCVAESEDARSLGVPVLVPAADGTPLKLCAMTTDAVFDWPLEQADRVFIELTPARARQIALHDFDEQRRTVPPEVVAKRIAECGGESRYIEMAVEWSLGRGMADVAHVTSHMRDEIAARHNVDGLIDALAERITERVMQAEAGAEAAAHEYVRVACAYLRGDLVRGGSACRRLGFGERGVFDPRQIAVTGLDHRDRKNAKLSPLDWAAAQTYVRDHGYRYPVVFHTEVTIPEDTRFTIHLQVEYVGLRLQIGDSRDGVGGGVNAVDLDIGTALVTRYTFEGAPSEWTMLEHWPIALGVARGKALATELESKGPTANHYIKRAFNAMHALVNIEREGRDRAGN